MASSRCIAATWLADTCAEEGKVEDPPSFDGASAIDAMHEAHNSAQKALLYFSYSITTKSRSRIDGDVNLSEFSVAW